MNEQSSESQEPVRCVTCGLPITTPEIPRLEGEPCCRRCLAGFAAAVRHANETPATPTTLIPWLRREELGVPRAFAETVGESLSHPVRFFSRLPMITQLWTPLFFAVLCTAVFYFPGLLINETLVFPAIVERLEQVQAQEQLPTSFGPVFEQMKVQLANRGPGQWMLLMVQFVIIDILLASWIQQIFVYLAGGRRGYEVTLQVRCYSLVGMCLHLIPVIGLFFGQIYWIVMNALGLREVHGIPIWLSVVAAMSPLLIVFLFWTAAVGA